MSPQRHELKAWPAYFEAVKSGVKTFEVRKNDRGYQVGDDLVLNEWSPDKGGYTGRKIHRMITYIFDEGSATRLGHTGWPVDTVVLGLSR